VAIDATSNQPGVTVGNLPASTAVTLSGTFRDGGPAARALREKRRCGPIIGASIEHQRDLHRGIYGGFLDIPHCFRVGGDGPLHSRRIGELLRRDAPAGEEDP
jgi:hypothetical protein